MPRSNYSYVTRPDRNEPEHEHLRGLIEKHPAFGFWQSYHRIRRLNFVWIHKRVYNVYTQMGLNIRLRTLKRLPAIAKKMLFQPDQLNQVWSIDFMSDSL